MKYYVTWICKGYKVSSGQLDERATQEHETLDHALRTLWQWAYNEYAHMDRLELYQDSKLLASYEVNKETLRWEEVDLSYPQKPKELYMFNPKPRLEI